MVLSLLFPVWFPSIQNFLYFFLLTWKNYFFIFCSLFNFAITSFAASSWRSLKSSNLSRSLGERSHQLVFPLQIFLFTRQHGLPLQKYLHSSTCFAVANICTHQTVLILTHELVLPLRIFFSSFLFCFYKYNFEPT